MRKLLDLRPGERRAAVGAFVTLLGITAGHTLLETARDALFLSRLPATRLPWVYLAIAALGLVLSRGKRSEKRRGVTVALLAASIITLGFWALRGVTGTWFLYALYIWTGVFASWVVVEFWLMLGASYTVVQAKRLYGFIGAGSVLGAVLGALVARALAAAVPAQHLLLGACGIFVLTAVGPALLLQAPAPVAVKRSASGGSLARDAALVGRDPYAKRILALVLLATIALTTVDYLFKASVARRYAPSELAAFFATVSVVLNAGALVVQLAGVNFVLRTFGVHRALWVLPMLMVLGSGGVVLGGQLAAALVLKGADGMLRHSLHRTSTELLYVPMPDATRTRGKPFIDLVGQRGGQALASLAILALVSFGAGERVLAIVVAVLAGAWIVVAAGIRTHYLDVFRRTLHEGHVGFDGALPALDLGALEALFAALNSQKDAEVLGALDLLAAHERGRLIPALALYHPSKAVVLRTLELFARHGRTDFLPITDRLMASDDPDIRSAALRARTAVAPDVAFLREHLADDRLEVRATALVGLLAQGDDPEAEAALAAIERAPSPVVRLALARAIGEQPSKRFETVLLALAESAEPEVLVEVAAAMGRMESERFVPVLIDMLTGREKGAAARDALVAIGEHALAELDRTLGDPTVRREVRWNVPRAIAAFPAPLSAPILTRHLDRASDGVIRFRVLRALARLRAAAADVELDRAVLVRATESAIRAAVLMIDRRLILEGGASSDPARKTPAQQLIVTLLRDKEAHARERLFMLLGLLHPEENFDRIWRGLASRNAKTRASSRELVENVVAPPFRDPVLTLIDDVGDAAKLAQIAASWRPLALDYDAIVENMLQRGDELALLAGYHAVERGLEVAETKRNLTPSAFENAIANLPRPSPSQTKVANA